MLRMRASCGAQKIDVILIALKGATQAMISVRVLCKRVRIILSGGVRGVAQHCLSVARCRGVAGAARCSNLKVRVDLGRRHIRGAAAQFLRFVIQI